MRYGKVSEVKSIWWYRISTAGILNSFTLESSYAGPNVGPRANTHFNIDDFLAMGGDFCEALQMYIDPEKVMNNYKYY